MAIQPYEPQEAQRIKALGLVRSIGKPFPNIAFDVPELYTAEASPSRVGSKMILVLLSQVALVLRGMLKNTNRPRGVLEPVINHFEHIRTAPLKVDFKITGSGSSYAELFLVTPGLDSMTWRVLLDFFKANPDNWRNLVGDCETCRKLFEKSRADRKYCSTECRAKANYSVWKGHGLDERKKERAKAKDK